MHLLSRYSPPVTQLHVCPYAKILKSRGGAMVSTESMQFSTIFLLMHLSFPTVMLILFALMYVKLLRAGWREGGHSQMSETGLKIKPASHSKQLVSESHLTQKRIVWLQFEQYGGIPY